MARRFWGCENIAKIRHGSVLLSSSSAPLRWAPLGSSSSFSSPAQAASAIPKPFEPQEALRSRWSKLLLFVPGAITFGLGSWQILRRQEKIKMLEYRENRLGTEPINWNDVGLSYENKDSLEFRRVVCRGHFDEKNSFYIGPRSRSISGVTENGYYLITPLVPITHTGAERAPLPIIVNRGWVPRSWRDKSLSKKSDTTEVQVPTVVPVEVVGVVRGSEQPSIFVPANDPTISQWFYVDVSALALKSGLPENATYMEAINENVNPSNPYPIPKDTNALLRSSVMPQDHLNYTLTWYSLSAAVTFMAFKRLKPKRI